MSQGYDRVLELASSCARKNVPLAPFLSYKVGGPADVLAEPKDTQELAQVLRGAYEGGVPVYILGGGTNLIVRDGGIRAVVVRLGRGFKEVHTQGTSLIAGAAATMTRAAIAAEAGGLAGFTFGYDIPGTVGGALWMNAGAHGTEVRDVLGEVRGVTYEGEPIILHPEDIKFEYRRSHYPVELVVSEVVFTLRPGSVDELAAQRKQFHQHRLQTQPKGRSVGSVFKNPPGDHAGRLIEAAGLKGLRIGGVLVSEKHANFILNDQNGTAADIEALIRTIQQAVKEKFSVDLETEVQIVGS